MQQTKLAGQAMNFSRRHVVLGLTALSLSACGNAIPAGPVRSRSSSLPDDLRPVPNSAYNAWVRSFRQRASAKGISDATLSVGFRNTGYLPGVVKRDRNQTEFKRTLEDYLSIAASDERVSKGRAAYAKHRTTLNTLEAKYGVDAEIIAAIWGLESFFGERRGDVPVVSATSTLAFDGRRGAFFEKQLASTAAYLSKNGWKRGTRWGGEVGSSGAGGTLLQPQAGGPKFGVTSNFRAIKRYNNSDAYAIGVGHLADRIGGGGPLRASFPPDKNGLTKDDRVALQQRLTRQGFDTDGADGVIGPNSEKAIRAYQASRGLPVTGRPSQELLRGLG